VGDLADRAAQLKKKWPGYAALVDFYVAVRLAQDKSKATVRVDRAKAREREAVPAGEPAPSLVEADGFPIDLDAAIALFRTLCRLGRTANPHFSAQVEKIGHALEEGTLELERLLPGGGRDQAIELAAADLGLDAGVLAFLARSSTRPSIEAGRDLLAGELEAAPRGGLACPVCGSPPELSLLKGEHGLRHCLCSHCGFVWGVDRVSCAACGNKAPVFLQYLHVEGEGAHRVDLCDRCHRFIKTIDCRSLEEPDPCLEDLATLHLDVVAAEKGYTRVVPGFWNA
jgi:FdhE protein